MPNRKPLKTASTDHERRHYEAGYQAVVGIDEAGRGTWAGPVAAGAVCFPYPQGWLSEVLKGVNDSKMLTARQRENLVDTIKKNAIAWGVGLASNIEIDTYGIVPATKLAMQRAVEAMRTVRAGFTPDCLLLDSMNWDECPFQCHQMHIPKGDQNSLSIAAASILAKTARDSLMREYDTQYPGYGFAAHKGYGTRQHLMALETMGVTPLHRHSFAPIRRFIDEVGS